MLAILCLTMATEQLTKSAEEEKLLKEIREEKEKLWIEIQVGAS